MIPGGFARRLLLGAALIPIMASSGVGVVAMAENPATGQPPARPAVVAPLAAKALLLDAVSLDDRQLVAVGERGIILHSADAGQHWQQQASPTDSLLTRIIASASGRLIAVGHDAAILTSDDRGQSWQLRNWHPEWEQPLFNAFFTDNRHGFAIGAYGLFLTTGDGGNSWQQRTISEDDFHLYGVTRLSDDSLLLVGEAGTMMRSADQGQSWQPLASPYDGTFFGVGTPPPMPPAEDSQTPPPPSAVLAFGLQGKLFESRDRGLSWQAIPLPVDAGVYRVLWPAAEQPLLLGHGGNVLRDRDPGPGYDWQLETLPDRKALTGGVLLPGNRLLAVGQGGAHDLSMTPPAGNRQTGQAAHD